MSKVSLVARCHIVEREPMTTSYNFSMTEPFLRGQVYKLYCMNHSLCTNYKPILDHVNDEWAIIVSNIIFLPVKKSNQFPMHTKKTKKSSGKSKMPISPFLGILPKQNTALLSLCPFFSTSQAWGTDKSHL